MFVVACYAKKKSLICPESFNTILTLSVAVCHVCGLGC